MRGMRRPLALLLALLIPAPAAADARGSVEIGSMELALTVIGEADGNDQVYSAEYTDRGFGAALGVDWDFGATVHAGGQLWLSLVDVATRRDSKREGRAIMTHLAPHVRIELPLTWGFRLDGHFALGVGFVTEPVNGSFSVVNRLGFGLSRDINDDSAAFISVNHLAIVAWPSKALFEDVRVKEPLFAGLSAMLLTIGLRGAP